MSVDPQFRLDSRLAADTIRIGKLDLCLVLLMNNAAYPWLVLVPQQAGLREIIDLEKRKQHRLMDEIALASDALRTLLKPTKLNVGALGNVVGQLHIHVIARFASDPAWPGPVWGKGPPEPYAPELAAERCIALRNALALRGD